MCVSVCVSITMCVLLLSVGESCCVCVVCWLRARHHVRVLCLGVHHDVSVFGGKGKAISASVLVILREHKTSTTRKAPWLTSCSGDAILPPPRAGRPCLRLSNTKKNLGLPSDTECHSQRCKKRCSLGVTFQRFCLAVAAAAASFEYC